MAKRRIKIEEITKIEGHANLTIEISGNNVENVCFGIHEGSRYFEAFMKGRRYYNLPELSGRICGICTVAHEIASVKAVERALDVDVSEEVMNIRKLLLISSHIQSHILHLYFLALPDYAGVESAIELAEKDLDLVKRAFKLKEAANYLTALIGGRAVHPCTVLIGSMGKSITRKCLENYTKKIKEMYPLLVETAKLFLSLNYPNFERKCEYVSLYDGESIPLYDGKIRTNMGMFRDCEYQEHIYEWCVNYSSAKRSLVDGRDYMVGALARLNLNPYLREEACDLAEMCGVKFPSSKIAFINVAQALECVHYALEAMEIAEGMREYYPKKVEIKKLTGEGVGVIEAPRGLLIHHYKIKDGKCQYANIITPTAMNTENIERTIRDYVSKIVDKSDEVIKSEVQKIIRAYDPCISCAVHLVRVS